MKCFNETEIDNPKFPKLSRRAKFLKESEGGMMIMCDVMEEYMEQARQEGRTGESSKGKATTFRFNHPYVPEWRQRQNRTTAKSRVFAGNVEQVRTVKEMAVTPEKAVV